MTFDSPWVTIYKESEYDKDKESVAHQNKFTFQPN